MSQTFSRSFQILSKTLRWTTSDTKQVFFGLGFLSAEKINPGQ